MAENLSGAGADPLAPGLGDLGLSDAEEDLIVAFLASLSDEFTARPPRAQLRGKRNGR